MSAGIVRFCDGSGDPVRFVCPVCADAGGKARILTVEGIASAGGALDLYRCGSCGSLVYHPRPQIDYTQHTSGELSFRDYIEFNGAIDVIARNILKVIAADRPPGKLLDIGCGFGFGLDAVRGMLGWQVMGFEPSRYGEAGREQLGLDIIHDFAARNTDPARRFDIVHCSEVIEHIGDPHEFAATLTSWLADDGVLVLTTPDADRIHGRTDPSALLALLSPGAHTIIFSAAALTDVLKKAGLGYVEIDRSGTSMLVYASRRPLEFQSWPADQFARLLQRHLQAALRRAPPETSLEVGLRYRLFRNAMDTGNFALARSVFTPVLADANPPPDAMPTIEQFAARWPLCIAASTYYRGMLSLLHTRQYDEAARYFRAAYRFCRIRLALFPATAVVESDLVWRAIYHQALALSHGGEREPALALLARITDVAQAPQPPVPDDLLPAVIALRESLERPPRAHRWLRRIRR